MGNHPDSLYIQSAVIPYRIIDGKLRILLITSRRRKRWIAPKGVVEPDMTPADSAAKEAWEEAGIRGEVDQQALGEYTYKKWGGTCTVTVYAMHVTKELRKWPEDFRSRKWLSPKQAAKRVREKDLKRLIKRFAKEMKVTL